MILNWLASKFEVGVQYPEYMVDEILKRYHPDCINIKNELIGWNLLQGEKGIYWR